MLETSTPALTATPASTPQPEMSLQADPLWKTYTNDYYGLSFQYPACYGALIATEPTISDAAILAELIPLSEHDHQSRCSIGVYVRVYPLQDYYYIPTYEQRRYRYDPEQNRWLDSVTGEAQDVPTQSITGGVAFTFDFGDAEKLARVLAIPSTDQRFMVEITISAEIKGNAPEPNDLPTTEEATATMEAIVANITLYPSSATDSNDTNLAVDQAARVLSTEPVPLWSNALDAIPLHERPTLYPGALVTVRAWMPTAVEVETPEGLRGWIHQPASYVLTADLAIHGPVAKMVPQWVQDEQYSFWKRAHVQVMWPNGLPLRSAPSSTADIIEQRVAHSSTGTVLRISGDWVQIALDGGKTGWMRWYYDGTHYVEPQK